MKIVHICLAGLYMSGWGYQDNMLAKYHKLAGHDVYVIANKYVYDEKGNYKIIENSQNKEELYETDCNDVKIVRLSQRGNKQQKGPAERVHYYRLYKNLLEIKPDIIFLHNPQIMDIEDIVRYMKEHGKNTKLFVDSHSDYSNSARNIISKHILHGIIWRSKVHKLIKYTEKFYGVLPARVDFLLERYKIPKEKTKLLYMGMDTELAVKAEDEKIISKIKEECNINQDDFFIISGGKIDHAKRQTFLLMKAVEAIDNPNLKLVIFGSVVDDMKEEFNNLLKAAKHIKYIGWLNADQTYPYFAAADIAIFPGRHSVMWEQAAGQGIPLIIKDWEGTRHVDLGGNAIFLYKDSMEEIKEVIESLMNKGEKYQVMKCIAREKGREIFSYENIAKNCIL